MLGPDTFGECSIACMFSGKTNISIDSKTLEAIPRVLNISFALTT